jgi:S1-C subfamily serine protease
MSWNSFFTRLAFENIFFCIKIFLKILGRDNQSASAPESGTSNVERVTQNSIESKLLESVSVRLAPCGKPFAVVDRVVPASPADVAGLKDGDRITAFADISTETKGR